MVLKHTLVKSASSINQRALINSSPSGLLDRKLSELEPGVVKICDASVSVYYS
jgi:hypothetical protein